MTIEKQVTIVHTGNGAVLISARQPWHAGPRLQSVLPWKQPSKQMTCGMRALTAPMWLIIFLPTSRVHEKQNPSTSRSQLRQQSGVTPRSSSQRPREKKEGTNSTMIAPAPASCRSGDGTTARSAMSAIHAGVQTSARSVGTAASLSSSRGARGLHGGSDSGRDPLSARTTSRSHISSAVSPTDYSTDTPR